MAIFANPSASLSAMPELLGTVNAYLEPTMFLADKMFTPTPVDEIVGHQDIVDAKSVVPRRKYNASTGGTGSRRGQAQLSLVSYECFDFSYESLLTQRQKAIYQNRIDLMTVESRRLAIELLVNRDLRCIDQFWNRTAFPNDGVAGSIAATNWSTSATADARRDVEIAHATAKLRFGASYYDRILMGDDVWKLIWRQASIRADFAGVRTLGTPKSTDAAALSWLADQFAVEEVVVVDSVVNTAKDGQTEVISRVVPSGFVMLLTPSGGKGDPKPGFGKLLHCDKLGGLMSFYGYAEDREEQDILRAKECVDEFVQNSSCAHLLGIAGS